MFRKIMVKQWSTTTLTTSFYSIPIIQPRLKPGWWSGTSFIFPFSREFHHPNLRTHIFLRGRVQPPASFPCIETNRNYIETIYPLYPVHIKNMYVCICIYIYTYVYLYLLYISVYIIVVGMRSFEVRASPSTPFYQKNVVPFSVQVVSFDTASVRS